MTHAELQSAVVAVLKSLPNCWVLQVAEHTGGWRYGANRQHKGALDIIAGWQGKYYGFEIKVGADKLSDDQEREIETMLRAGAAWAGEVRSVDTAIEALGLNKALKGVEL